MSRKAESRRRSRYLISTEEQPRVRRATDVTAVVIWLLVLFWMWRLYSRVESPEVAIADLLAVIPSWLSGVLSAVYAVCLLYVLGLIVAVLFQWKTRLDAIRDMFLAMLGTSLLLVLLVRLVDGEWPLMLPELGLADPVPQFPITRVAMVTALLVAIAPHLTRPLRRLGWAVILLTATAGVALGLGLPSSAIGGIALGWTSAAIVLLIFGSPRGYPNTASIEAAMEGLGVPVSGVRLDDDQSWGVRRLIADSPDRGRVEIKAYGRDATDSQWAARTWRYIWYRDSDETLTVSRMQSVEHEALVTMMAERTGASVPHVLAAGLGGDDVAILAVDRSGERLSDLSPEAITDEQLAGIWRSVAAIHAGVISHGSLNADSITITEQGHQIGDFGFGGLAASEASRATDLVELLFSFSLLYGTDRAVASARAGLGDDALHNVLPYVQVPAVSRTTKNLADKPKEVVKEIHDAIAEGLQIEEEEPPVELRRVQPRNLVMTGLSLFAAYFLISQLSDIDFVAVWDEIQNANWFWIVAAFIVGQLVFVPEATGMLAAVGLPIPLWPSVILQSAIKFISLAVPSAAGRIGMQAAFLRKYGVEFSASVLQGSVDSISGLLVEISILLIALITGSLDFGFSTGETEWGIILLVIVVVGLAAFFLLRRVKRLRDWLSPIVGEAVAIFGGVLKDANRALGLLASNLGSRLLLAVSLWMILQSLGVSIGLFSALVCVVAAALLAGIVPIPGGIGVAEAVLTAFLVTFGVDETTAFAAAVVYRVVTFYIPSGYGWFSMNWLDKNGYI